jgi:hypothetical protein
VGCAEVLAAIIARRGTAVHEETVAMAVHLRAKSPHVDIPIDKLVEFHAPVLKEGRSNVPSESDDLDVLTRHVLCDPLLYEVVSQQYLATHPEYRL